MMSATPLNPLASIEITATDLDGNPLGRVEVGDTFLLNVTVEDTRQDPQGVFAMYFDLLYDSALLEVVGEIQHADSYPSLPTGDSSIPGIVNESGGFSVSIKPLGGGALPLYSVPVRAIAPGTALIASDPADCGPVSDVSIYGQDETVPVEYVGYGQTTLQIGTGGKSALTISDLIDAVADADGCHMVTQTAPPIDETPFLDSHAQVLEASPPATFDSPPPRYDDQLLGGSPAGTVDTIVPVFAAMARVDVADSVRVLWLDSEPSTTPQEVVTTRVPLLDLSSPVNLGTALSSSQNAAESTIADHPSAVDESLELLDEVFAHFGELERNLAIV